MTSGENRGTEASRVAALIAAGAALCDRLLFIFDIDRTLTYDAPCTGCVALAPDAYLPVGLDNTLAGLKALAAVEAIAVTGRSVAFMQTYLGLNGSGQFHAEVADLETGAHSVLKQVPDFEPVAPVLGDIWARHQAKGAWIEDDKSHYRGVMNVSVQPFEAAQVQAALALIPYAGKDPLVLTVHADGLEIGPTPTNKAVALESLDLALDKGVFPVYFGDSPKMDGPAMAWVQAHGGLAVGVGASFRHSPCAWLESPHAVHACLRAVKGALAYT